MSQKTLKMYKIDERTAQDVEARIGELAASYTPEWQFSIQDPDIGATISRIFARQMQDNIHSVNHMTEIYHAAFVNFLDLTLKRAVPAGSVVCFELVDSTVAGAQVPKGTLVTTDDGDEENVSQLPVFETERDLYVTGSHIRDIFMTDREVGSIVPLMGHFTPPELYTPAEAEAEEDVYYEEDDSRYALRPFVLFGQEEEGDIGSHALAILHPSVFDVQGESIFVRMSGSERLMQLVSRGELVFYRLGEEGLVEFDDVSITEDGAFRLVQKDIGRKVLAKNGEDCNIVVLKASHPLTETVTVDSIRLSSAGAERYADYVGDGNSEMRSSEFAPFSDTLSVYAECYIGKRDYFDKPGSRVNLDFHLSFREHSLEVTKEKEVSDLKIIKRKTRMIREEVLAETYADEAQIEYFNGIGWKALECEKEYRSLFATENPGQYKISFICPADWAETESGAYQGRMLRLRLLRADNCYMRPAIHHYPVLSEFKISYSFEGRELYPVELRSLCGTSVQDLTIQSRREEKLNIFTPISYAEDALYIGFDAPIESGPVGIFFRLQGGAGQAGVQCCFEYSSRMGFRQIKIADGTEGFTHSGIVMFLPPSDFAAIQLEGKKRYWLRILREGAQQPGEVNASMVHVEDIKLNAVMVINAVNTPEQDFFIEEAKAGQRYFLGAGNILDTEVWVNERAGLAGDEMRSLAVEHPDEVRLEYDAVGNIISCFVHWKETEQFEEWSGLDPVQYEWDRRRVYRIDRLSGEIIFGDGIHTEIPRVLDDVAFKVRLRTSAGEGGNLPAGSLTEMPMDIPFIDSVKNPVRSYGGSNMETVRQALMRGADRIYSRDRMVSMNDFKRAIQRFSTVIDKVAGVPGLTVDGREDPSELSFVLLMKDHCDGSFSFHRVEAPLKRYLLNRCEITVAPERLHIVEPVFVEVSVSVWTEVMDMDDSFEVQNQIRETLDRYLDPVCGGGEDGEGWQIGTMPKRMQLLLQLSGLKNTALIRKTSITVRYRDFEGQHEMDYDDLKVNPFMVCTSGTHQVNIMYKKGDDNAED